MIRTVLRLFVLSWPAAIALGAWPGTPSMAVEPFAWQTGAGPAQQIDSTEAWERHRRRIVAAVEEVMGPLPNPPQKTPLRPKVLETVRDGAVIRKKLAYHTDDPDQTVHAWLLLPADAVGPVPAALCLHQTVAVGKDEPAGVAGDPELAYARELAERGVATLSPDYPSFGEYAYDFSDDAYASGSMKAIYDTIRAIDLMQTIAEIDGTRIAVIGHSLGGHHAIFTALFDQRLRVVVTSCGFTSFAKYYGGDLRGWTSPRYMPRIAERYGSDPAQMPVDFTDLGAALAPRPWMPVAPLADHNFDVEGVRDVVRAARRVYQLYDAESRLAPRYPDCEHRFPRADRERAYQFILHHLQPTAAE